jgi:membrane-associated phospholipid phosphatase
MLRHVFLACLLILSGALFDVQGAARPLGESVRHAAGKAALDPATWIPLAAAGIVFLSGKDAEISQWASDNTPVFGSRERASEASDLLAGSAAATALIAAAAVPPSRPAKEKELLSVAAASGLTVALTESLKLISHRPRPDNSGDNSFPSGHTSFASANAYSADHILQEMDTRGAPRFLLSAVPPALAAGTGWARVEAKKHYLTDVLAGAALGCFAAAFVSDLADELFPDTGLTVAPAAGGISVVLAF